jgi:hypothetical protein
MKKASGTCAARQTFPFHDTKQKPCHRAGLIPAVAIPLKKRWLGYAFLTE